MIFKRLDEDTVRCIINEEDMKEYGITMEDFLTRRGNIEGFLKEVIEQAIDEVDFKADGNSLSMQVMNLPKNRIAITFSGKEDGGVEDVLSRIIRDKGLMKEMMDDTPEDIEVIDESMISSPDIHDYDSEEKSRYDIRILAFSNYRYLEQYCKALPEYLEVKSSVFKENKTRLYYLAIEKGKETTREFKSICELGEEFGTILTDDKVCLAYLQEETECIIKKEAIQVIAAI